MRVKNIHLKRMILEELFKEDLGYLTDIEIDIYFNDNEDNTYYINELNSSLDIRNKKIKDSKNERRK